MTPGVTLIEEVADTEGSDGAPDLGPAAVP